MDAKTVSAMRHAGWGASLETRTRCEEPLGGQLEKWTTFTYYTCGRADLEKLYVGDTLRADICNGSYLVSACRRNRLVKIMESIFPGFLFWGRRDLLEIHVRK